MNMNSKYLIILIGLAAAGTLNLTNLNAAESARSPKVLANQPKTPACTTSDPNLLARNPDIAATPKVLANFPQMARSQHAQTSKPRVACACCKR